MEKVCIIIRVYNRTEDLKYCVSIIRDTWKSHNYFVIVVANGRKDGYVINEDTAGRSDLLIETGNNIGHFTGNSQLLLAAVPHIPADCAFTIILEADTWFFGDDLVAKYIHQMKKENAIWASAQFFRYVLNLATDFAIIKTALIRKMPEVFAFSQTPEYYIGNFLMDRGLKFIYIKELMPVSLPRYARKYPFAPTGRFFVFPNGRMVSHHVEHLKNGMAEKKFYFNAVAGRRYFDVPDKYPSWLILAFLRLLSSLSVLMPYKSWFIKRKNLKARPV